MKVVAQFQFYFSYVFPRDSDWPVGFLDIKFSDAIVRVRPRAADEVLFPNEVDKTLSTMELTIARINPPTGQMRISVQDRCYDRVEVRVEAELPSLERARDTDLQDHVLDTAIRACNLFVSHCRIAARSPFLLGVERHCRIEDGRFYVLTPYSVSWFSGKSGERLGVYPGDVNGQASFGAVPSPERGAVSWTIIHLRDHFGELRTDLSLHWVRPTLVVEVEYRQRLKDGLRHAAVKGLRPEKKRGVTRRSSIYERGSC